MNDEKNIFRIGIIGAGPSGLTLALALSKRENMHITVFEKAPDHRNAPSYNPMRSYTIDITGHGARAIEYLNMKERFNKNLILFKGIRIPAIHASLEEPYHGDGWTGSRGDIVKVIQEEIIEQTQSRQNVTILFDTEATIQDAENGIIAYQNGNKTEAFDLIVGCDGAGSTVRNYLESTYNNFTVTSLDNGNYSQMLPFDKNTAALDPRYLYIFGMPPYLAVAGAINGKNGPTDPLWFCQIGYSGSRKFNSFEEAKSFLLAHYPSTDNNALTHYASDQAIEAFSKQDNISTGRAKICSSFHVGKLVLLGDAAAPFPPVGQGVNAAMEMAIVLDACIGEQLGTNDVFGKNDNLQKAITNFAEKWKPEADAIRTISFHGLNLQRFHPPLYGKVKTFSGVLLDKLFHRDPMTNAKRNDMLYSQALAHQKKVDSVLYGVALAALIGVVYWNL
jgi:kynurenine 3-monooxygenase